MVITWVPSFLCAKRKLMGNAGPIGRASDDSAPPWLRKPEHRPPDGGGLQSAAPPFGLQGLLLDAFQVLCARALLFLVTIQVSPLFSSHRKLQQKSQHATDSVHGAQWTFLRRSALWESPFAGASDLVQSRGNLDTIHTDLCSQGGSNQQAFLKTCPWLCSGSNHLLSNYRSCRLSFPYALFDNWHMVCSCRIPLF